MSLRNNIVANYVSQIYVTLIGIVLLPLYMQYMGPEAFGLIGFFAMLQAWFGMLDLGLTPTIARESARYHGGALSALAYRQLFRALSVIFFGIAVLGGCGLWFLSDLVATRWLEIRELAHSEVLLSLKIMAVSVALRWLCGLFRGVITGAEKLVWISGYGALIATLRFVVVFGSMAIWGYTPTVFFTHQFFVAALEVLGFYISSMRLLPSVSELKEPIGWSFKPVNDVVKFALTIAFTASVWVLVTQTDKLVLSGVLPLAEYGYFTLAVLVASGIIVISGPVSNAIMPRMARLYAEGQHAEMINVYRQATQLVVVMAGSAAITMVFCAESLLYAWSGDAEMASNAAPILRLYAVGNGILAIGAFPYYLQYAKGNLRYHLISNVVIGLVLIPGIVFAASNFGAVGAGWVWMGFHAVGLVTWAGYVHYKLQPGLHFSWLRTDVLAIVLPASFLVFLVEHIFTTPKSRIEILVKILVLGVVSLATTAIMAPSLRKRVFKEAHSKS